MDKVIVVDDEKWVSEVIKMLIPWEDYGFRIVQSCTNGLEAMEALRAERPGLVFTDIRMPGMDGIEFLKNASGEFPDTMFVVISGYNDFEYAKGALTYGAVGYLLKPIDENELKQIVIKARSVIDDSELRRDESKKMQERYEATMEQLRNAYFDKVLSGSVIADRHYMNYELKYNFRAANYQLIVFFRGRESEQDALTDIISRALWKEQLPSRCHEVAVLEYRGSVVCLFNYDYRTESTFPESRDKAIRQIVQNNAGLTAYVGNVYGAIGETGEEYEKLKRISLLRMMREDENVFYFSRYQFYGKGPDILPPRFSIELKKRLADADRPELVRLIHGGMDDVVKQAGTNPVALYHGISRLLSAIGTASGTGIQDTESFLTGLSDLAEIRQKFDALADRILLVREKEQAEKSRSVTDRMVEYIDTGYMNNISLTDASEKFNLNPNYVSDIFRKNTGISFKEYLTNTRMNAAKQILRDTNLKIAEVARRVGYNDVKNFSRIFKKYIGISPVEYRNLMG